jgi:RNA polymerase sigma-70 factor (ECF subfamily)
MCADGKKKKESKSKAKEALAQLARRARDGEEGAFREWMNQTYSVVQKLVHEILGESSGTDDVLQEVYTRAWQSIARLEKLGASLGWLCRIARFVISDSLRHPSRREILILDQSLNESVPALIKRISHPDNDPEAKFLSAEECVRRYAALKGLKTEHRDILLLREVHGMSYEETAKAMGLPLGTVKSTIHRARAKLKELIKKTSFI